MTEEIEVKVDELTELKKRADLLGIEYHPKISVDKLRARIKAQLEDTAYVDVPDDDEVIAATSAKRVLKFKPETQAEIADRLRKEAQRLVRVRITCMNPNKKDWDGDVFTVSNSVVGTLRKYVPFNAEDGWHIPTMMLDFLRDKQFVQHYVEKKNGQEINRHKLVKEFAIEVLDPLTQEELKELAQRQAMARNVD